MLFNTFLTEYIPAFFITELNLQLLEIEFHQETPRAQECLR